MKIVVMDGHGLNPGDLSWAGFERFGELVVHERTPDELVLPRAKGADALLVNKTVIDAALLRQLPELRYIGVLATGYNTVDTAACREHGGDCRKKRRTLIVEPRRTSGQVGPKR